MTRGKIIGTVILAFGLLSMAACGPKYPNCKNDEHCKDYNQYCVDGQCRDCSMNAHCASKGPCAFCGPEYTCDKPAGGAGDCCGSDLDCKQGKCWKMAGSDRGTCAQCAADADCGSAMKCVQGNCVPRGECGEGMPPCPAGKRCENNTCVVDVCQLQPIYFDFDESAIRADARDILNTNYQCVKERGQNVAIEGHCDERGSDEYNLALGMRRANAAKKFLQKLGLGAKQMSTTSLGEERPVCTDQYEGCWSRNRRGEFRFR